MNQNDNSINVVMSTDCAWQPMYVAVKSIIENKKDSTSVHFHFLVADSFSKENESVFLRLLGQNNVSFYHIECMLDDYKVKSTVAWISYATYYRLLIPEVLLNIDKCLYLDTDIFVKEDLSALYNEDVSDVLIAGVYAIAYHKQDDTYIKKIGLESNDQYLNAGMLLMNLEKMREMNLSSNMKNMILQMYPSQDQDIINIACYGKIKALPFKYNAMTKYYGRDLSMYKTCYSVEEIKNAWIKPVIIHYAGAEKPWNSVDCPLSEAWWRICYGSIVEDYYTEVIKKVFYYYLLYARREKNYEEWEIKVRSKLSCASAVALYGAGVIAKQCLEELALLGITPKYVIQTEKSDDDMFYGIPIISSDEIDLVPKDSPIIIGVSQRYEKEVIEKLENKGRSSSIILLRNEKIGFYDK